MEEINHDVYWDLKDLNPDAQIYVEYHDAFIGFTFKNPKYVAVYDCRAIENIIAQELMQDEMFLDKAFREMNGKVEKKDLTDVLSRLAKIEAIKGSSELINEWINENDPVIFFLPKVIEEQQLDDGGEELFRYE